MNLSSQQEHAVLVISKWLFHSDAQTMFLGGYAGTGKTTMLKHLLETITGKSFFCCAPTGKAASVLARKLGGQIPVTTVHSALYNPSPPSLAKLLVLEGQLVNEPNNQFIISQIQEEKERLSNLQLRFSARIDPKIRPTDFVIVEECSMVTQRMYQDLIDTGAKILFVGDPGQLPPVGDTGFKNQKPDVMLTEVHRQALDSPIIRLSRIIREGSVPATFAEPFCRKVKKSEVDHDAWLRANIVLSGKNETRRKINRFFRQKYGHGESVWPRLGEKLICIKNMNSSGRMLINGVETVSTSNSFVSDATDELYMSYLYEGDPGTAEAACKYPFEAHYDTKAVDEPWQMKRGLVEFDFGYCITVHKSQGSEWDYVVLADDEMMADKPDFRKRWLYTAVTRAKKELLWLT